jgi:hypothetical protein
VGGHFFDGFDKVVADARAAASAVWLDAPARRALARSFALLFFEYRHCSAVNEQNSGIVALLKPDALFRVESMAVGYGASRLPTYTIPFSRSFAIAIGS